MITNGLANVRGWGQGQCAMSNIRLAGLCGREIEGKSLHGVMIL